MIKATLRKTLAGLITKVPQGIMTDHAHFDLFQSAGWHATPVHFYQPIPDTSQLPDSLWDTPSELPGIDKNMASQIQLLKEIDDSGFLKEYHDLPTAPAKVKGYSRDVGFGGPDGALLYGLIRKFQPKRIIEIGAGHSTILATLALEENGKKYDFTTIEPFPQRFIKENLGDSIELIPKPVEQIPANYFQVLDSNDILFIDSSHTIRIGGDVLHEILEILPRLKPGVVIHIHDIFLPHHLPKDWVKNRHMFWDEQYLIQAFLAFNSSFEIIWSYGLMHSEQKDQLSARFPGCHRESGGSLWLRRVKP